MQTIQNVLNQIQPGKKILFQTPAMKDRFVQGATVLDVNAKENKITVETQGKEQVLGADTKISIVI